MGDTQAVSKAFESAAHVTRVEIYNNRVTAVPMEPRGAVAMYDAASDSFEFVCATQNVHANRDGLAEKVLHLPKDKIHLVANDIGGGFGVKNGVYPEYALVLFAARRLNRPVKWVADRSESFLSDSHGRDQRSTVELALDKDRRFLALRSNSVGNIGRIHVVGGPLYSDWRQRTYPRRTLSNSGNEFYLQGGVYQYRSNGALSWRRSSERPVFKWNG